MIGIRLIRAAVVAALGVSLVVGTVTAGNARGDTGVTGHDASDTFVVNGSSSGADRESSAGCAGCAQVIWVPACLTTSPTLHLVAPGQRCLTVGDDTCDSGERFLREWTADSGGWSPGSARCRSVGTGISVAQIAAAVREIVRHRVPVPSVSIQPHHRPLVSLPVLVHSGHPDGGREWHDSVAGVAVTTRVSASWHWTFGDGAELTTQQAGSRWPDTAVSHTYDTPGRHQVSVEATWSGTFEVPGLGERAIGGSVTQRDTATVLVTTAGARYRPDLR